MKKILVLHASPRKNGNTAEMVRVFCDGAREKGHHVTLFSLGDTSIHPCKACDYCQTHQGKCSQSDDMAKLYPLLQSHDTLVIAAPVYYLGFPGILKNAIDRTYAESAIGRKIRYSILLTAACKQDPSVTKVMTDYYQALMSYLGIKDLGIISAFGVDAPGELISTESGNTSLFEDILRLGQSL